MIRLPPSKSQIVAIAPLLLLCACGTSSSPQAASTATGEILPGSVSDAMLDTDRSQAQAPLAPSAYRGAPKAEFSVSADASEIAVDAAGPAEAPPADPDTPRPKPATSAKPGRP